MKRPLRLISASANEAALGGACAGLAYWLGFPTKTIRVLFVLGLLTVGEATVFIYILMLLLPDWDEVPEDYHEVTGG